MVSHFTKSFFLLLIATTFFNMSCSMLSAKETQQSQLYDGIDHVITFQTTFLNAKIQAMILEAKNQWYNLSKEEQEEEKKKQTVRNKNATHFLLSAYSANSNHDDFRKKNSIWKIQLLVDKATYPCSVKTSSLSEIEIRKLFPNFNVFGSLYEIVAPISLAKVTEAQKVTLVITSPLGKYQHKVK